MAPGVRIVHDDRAFEGPLAGVSAGLAAIEAGIVLIVAGDMPVRSCRVSWTASSRA